MDTPTPPNRRASKGAMVLGASSVAVGLAAAVGLVWLTDGGSAPAAAAACSPCAALANVVFAAL